MLFILILFVKISSQQSNQQKENNYLNFPLLNLEREQVIGSFSKYSPLNNILHLENVHKRNSHSYLIYMAKQIKTQKLRIAYYVEFLIEIQRIDHYFIIQTCSNQIEVQFKINILDYEGRWCFQYLYFKDDSELIIGLECGDQNQFKSYYSDRVCFQELIYIYGQSIQFLKQGQLQNLTLMSFPGEVQLYQISNFMFLPEYKEEFLNGISQTLIFNPLIQYLQYSPLNVENLISQFIYNKSYDIQFWSKIKIKEINQKNQICILQIKPHNFEFNLNLKIFQLSYIKQQDQWFYTIEYYSYNYPYIKNIDFMDELKKSFSQNIEVEFITQWHFIEIKYLLNTLLIQLNSFITNKKYEIDFQNVYQFSDILLAFYFGENDQQNSNIEGEIGQFSYFNYVSLISQTDDFGKQQSCHYSCLNCWGPFNNHCLSCLESDNRIYDQQANTCQCKLWYQEEKGGKCYGSSDMEFIENFEYLPEDERYESENKEIICSYGYFKLNDQCIQCPSASQKGILNCVECLINPQKWIKKGYCEEQYSQYEGSQNNVYLDTYNGKQQTVQFFIVNEEVVSCDGCSTCSDQTIIEGQVDCFLYEDKHLDQDVYITCFFGEYQKDVKKCLDYQDSNNYDGRFQCQESCGYCMFRQCQFCKDPSKYFMDILGFCRRCDIENCKYCFQYNLYDRNQVSLMQGEIVLNEEDYVIACSLCYPGFVFDFSINQCIEFTVSYQCIDGFIIEDQFICTNTLLSILEIQKNIAIQFEDCLQFYSNCSKCLQDWFGMIICIECQYGYFLNFLNGICQLCSDKFNNSETCQMSSSSQDNWKNQVHSFYLNFKPNKIPILLQGMYFVKEYEIFKCQDGYMKFSLGCFQLKNQDCLEFDLGSSFCKTCKNSQDNIPILSYFDNQCQQCPYPCQVCQQISQDLISVINPYFITNEQSINQTHFCVLNFNQNLTFIETLTGQIRAKDQSKRRYYLHLEHYNFPSLQNPFQKFDIVLKKYLIRVKPTVFIQKFNSYTDSIPFNFREQIFSLKNSTFLYDGFNDSQHQKQFVITNQTTVNLKNVKIFHQSNQFISHSTFGVSLFINNISISNLNLEKTIFQFAQATSVYILNIHFSNMKLLNQPLFLIRHYPIQSKQKFYIHIENIIILDSNFTNTSIFSFYLQSQSEFSYININAINVINSYFNNASILDINSITFNISYSAEKILYKNSQLIYSALFRIPTSNTVSIQNLDILQSQFSDSIIISSISSFVIQNISIYQSTFTNSSLIIFTELFQDNGHYHFIYNLTLDRLDFCKASLISIKNDKDLLGNIKMQNFKIQNISSSCENSCSTSNCIFSYNSYSILIENATINNRNYFWYFCLQKFTFINFNNIFIEGNNLFSHSQLSQKIYLLKQTLSEQQELCGVIFIQDFLHINMNNLQLKNQFVLNSALILLISKGRALNNQNIRINSLSILNNYLMKTQSTQFASLLYINSEYFCETFINQSSFQNNLIIHFLEDYSFISPGLIYIKIYQQNIYFYQNIFYKNTLLNTSNSQIYLNSYQVKIKDIKVQNNNQNQRYQDIPNKSVGGFIFAKTEYFFLDDSIFQNLFAYQASCLFLELIRLGIVELNNIVIENATSWSNDQENALGGCLGINSMNSNLNLNLNSIKVKNCKSKHSNGFLYLIPSIISNQVIFNDIMFINVFSQSNLLFYFDFQSNNQINSVKLKNMMIIFEENVYQKTFSEIIEQNNLIQNSIISILNSNIQISNLYFEGISPQSILVLKYSNLIQLNNLYLNQVKAFGNNLISIQNNGMMLSENVSKKVSIKMALTNITIINSIFKENKMNINSIKSLLSIIIQKRNSNLKVQLFLARIQLIENSCQICQNGLIYLQLDQNVLRCKIIELFLHKNNCGQSGCLFVDQSELVELIDSKFIQNRNNGKGATNLRVNNFIGKNLLYLNNIGMFGGGLCYKSKAELRNLKKVYFVNNSANVGGAVYIEDTRIYPNTLQQILFIENYAKDLTSNIREQPSHLQLSVFGQKIMTIRDSNLGIPNFSKYNTENFIYIPSGQKIGDYEQSLSNKGILYQRYDINLQILPINTLGEILVDQEDSQCYLDLSDYINQQNKIISKTDRQLQIITYNNESQSYDLTNLTIVLDPYSQEIQFLRFKFQCNCIKNENYTYQFNTKSFTCKMGEYYFDSQCLLCDFKKGFYSVELKAQNCQKVDPKIIKSNTMNNVELYPGYWRPNIRSHYISKCFKNINNCQGGWQSGDDSCKEGSVGALCEQCDIYNIRGYGQYFKNQNYQCILCDEYAGKILFSVFINIIAIISIYLTVISVNSIFKSFKLLKNTTKYYKIIFRSNLDQSAALIKMIVNYCQIIVSIKSFQSDLYVNIADFLLPISNPIESSTFSYECYFATQYSIKIIYLTQILYIMLPAIQYLLFLTSYLILVICQKMKLTSTIYFTALIYLFFYTQPNIIKQFGGLIAMRTISKIDYININTQYLYHTQEHSNWIQFFIGPVIIIFGCIIPLLLLIILYKIKNYFNQERTRKIWGYLFNDYKENSYYWEIIKIFQRELIMLSLIINEERVILKSIITILVLLLYYFCFLQFQPYNVKALNQFEQESILQCGIIIILSSLHFQTKLIGLYTIDTLLQILQIIFSLYFIYSIIIYKVIQVYYTKYDQKLDLLRKKILMRHPQLKNICPSLRKLLVLRSERKKNVVFRFQLIKKAFFQQRSNLKSQYIGHRLKTSLGSPLNADFGEQTFILKQPSGL
ncbi:unnamed protein product [Paramecium sonneborni]|uniref:Transmembrane protein n=1 Tax=Paramecium sonneborni TaxID=65129 RepID=A0A8S1M0Y7_9CILI|nr:unnamed protein product [Paramecium sonneborni]